MAAQSGNRIAGKGLIPKGALEEEQAALFQYLLAIYQRALQTSGFGCHRDFLIGERCVRLSFAGEGLMHSLVPALAHLETSKPHTPALTVYLWDSSSTKTDMPRMVSQYLNSLGEWWHHLGTRGEICELTSHRIHAAYHLGPNILSLIDKQEGVALYWVKDSKLLPYYEKGSPLRTILHWWADCESYQFVHGAAVGYASGGVLLAGKGGSGKSTTALSCLEAGFLYASDDYCLVRTTPKAHVFSVYNTAKLKGEEDLRRFPRFASWVSNRDRTETEKAVIFLQQYLPQSLTIGFPIKAILTPKFGSGNDTYIRPISPGAILSALAPSTLFQLPGSGEASFQTLAKLTRQVPGYLLELGKDISKIPEAMAAFLLS